MAKLSRTEKYKDFRESLQNDVGSDIESRDLEKFQSRLNQINPHNFEAPKQSSSNAYDHDPIHARRSTYLEEESVQNVQEGNTEEMTFDLNQVPSSRSASTVEPTFNNDYLDRYINEVKQYNIDRGNAVSENTQVNVLHSIHRDTNASVAPSKPYTQTRTQTTAQTRVDRGTTEVPFINANVTPSGSRTQQPINSTENRSARDIASEVQSLVDDIAPTQQTQAPQKEFHTSSMTTDEFSKHLEMERTRSQQLLNETTHMRTKLEGYEDDLNEVSDKMQRTSQMLNIVLVVLIIALVIVLFIVIYWILSSRGGN